MTLSKREKYIAIGMGAAVALLIIDQLLINPYYDSMNKLRTQIDDAKQLKSSNASVLYRQGRLAKDWKVIRASGLTEDEYDAAQLAQGTVLEWARAADINVTEVKPERTTDAGAFQVISFHITGFGATPQLRRLLLPFETSKVPVRIVEMQVAPVKPGTDELKIELSISTLCLKPGEDATGGATASAAFKPGEGKTWN